MNVVRTVLGDIPASELGVCSAHEHIIIDPGFVTLQTPDFLLDSVDKAAEELQTYRAAGGRAVVDAMPCDTGRNVLKLAEVSRRTGIHIIAPTGLHLARYYPPGHWSLWMAKDELAELFVADIEQGIDANDYGGPDVRRTPRRAGVIKVATGRRTLDDRDVRILTAAAIAHQQTGAPILTHTDAGEEALAQVGRLVQGGVDPQHIVLSHTDRNRDAGYHRALLRTGARVEYDQGFRWGSLDENPTVKLIAELLPEHPDRIMLGMDAARRKYWRSHGGEPGLGFLLERLVPRLLSEGLDDRLVAALLVDNPARAFAFASPGGGPK
jgi:phosphotriesterase-related protein